MNLVRNVVMQVDGVELGIRKGVLLGVYWDMTLSCGQVAARPLGGNLGIPVEQAR